MTDEPSLVIAGLPPIIKPGRIDDAQLVYLARDPDKSYRVDFRVASHCVSLVVSGRGTFRRGDGPTQEVGPGSWFTVHPGPTFHYGPDGGTSWDECSIAVSGPAVDRWHRWGWLPNDGRVRLAGDLERAIRRFEAILRPARRGGPDDGDRAILAVENYLIELTDGDEGAPLDEVAEAFLAICRARFHEVELTPQQVAAELAVSYSALRQRVRAATGRSPGRLLRHVRVDEARRMLARDAVTVAEAARRTGFDNVRSFTRAFRDEVGLSPRAHQNATAIMPHARWNRHL